MDSIQWRKIATGLQGKQPQASTNRDRYSCTIRVRVLKHNSQQALSVLVCFSAFCSDCITVLIQSILLFTHEISAVCLPTMDTINELMHIIIMTVLFSSVVITKCAGIDCRIDCTPWYGFSVSMKTQAGALPKLMHSIFPLSHCSLSEFGLHTLCSELHKCLLNPAARILEYLEGRYAEPTVVQQQTWHQMCCNISEQSSQKLSELACLRYAISL